MDDPLCWSVHLGRRSVLRAATALCAAPLLPPARACEFFARNLRVLEPWTRATAPGADVAIVCLVIDQVSESDRLVGVETPLAERFEVGGPAGRGSVDIAIPSGRETQLSEAGTHLRLVGLKRPLIFGRAYPMTLVFEKGGPLQADLHVQYDRPA